MEPNSQSSPGGGSKIWIIIILVIVVILAAGGGFYWWWSKTHSIVTGGGTTLSTAENGGKAVKPANFPKDIPLYPKATYDAYTTSATDGSGYGATTADSKETVVNWFKTALPKNGWTADAINPELISFKKGDQTGNVSVTLFDGQTRITFSVVPKSALPEGYDQILEEQKELLKDVQVD